MQSKHSTLNETKWIVIYVEIQVAVSTKVSYDSISTLASEVLLSLCKQEGYLECNASHLEAVHGKIIPEGQ